MRDHLKAKQTKKRPETDLYGLDEEDSLQSVNFATTENAYLNEHYQTDPRNE